jgi:hypothetical protein
MADHKPNKHVVAMHLTAMFMPVLVKQAKKENALTAMAERGELKKSEARLLNWAKFLVEPPEMSTFQTAMMIVDMIAMDYQAVADETSSLPPGGEEA